MTKLTDKKTEKMCKEVDEEGYYRYIKERDAKRFSWIRFFKKEGVKKTLKWLFHMTGIHTLPHDSHSERIGDGNTEEFWTCETCGYECTFKGVIWELIKWVVIFFALFGILFSPLRSYLPPFTDATVAYLMIFLLIVHVGAGVRGSIEVMRA